MPSYFNLEKDTTAPLISVALPVYTHVNNYEYIRIESNELLSNIQDFYFIDSKGKRHDMTLEFHGTYFDGIFQFTDFPNGLITLYAQVFDEVLNPSVIYETTLVCYDKLSNCILDLEDAPIFEIDINEKLKNIINDSEEPIININLKNSEIIKTDLDESELQKIVLNETKPV